VAGRSLAAGSSEKGSKGFGSTKLSEAPDLAALSDADGMDNGTSSSKYTSAMVRQTKPCQGCRYQCDTNVAGAWTYQGNRSGMASTFTPRQSLSQVLVPVCHEIRPT
jgi:hypothetical protein